MKNIFKYFLLTVLLLIPVSVNALGFSCETGTYKFSDTFTCTITGTGDVYYKQVNLDIDDNELLECQATKFYPGVPKSSDVKKIRTEANVSQTGTTNFIDITCKVKVKISEDTQTQVVLKNVQEEINGQAATDPEILRSDMITVEKFVDTNTTTKTTDSKPRDTSNGNSLLKKLSDPELDKYFTFSKFITKYPIEVLFEVDQLNLEYETNVPDAMVRIEGSQKLEVGDNVIDIYVTSPDYVSTTCYTLNIKRLPSGQEIYYPDKDATLKKLVIKNHPIDFESVIKEYVIKIDSLESELNIEAATTVTGASYVIEGNKELKNKNVITITVTSKDNTVVEKYSITVIKEKEKQDYSTYYYLGIIVFILLLVIIFIVKSSNKRNSEVEKQMSKYAHIFKKKDKKQEQNVVPSVTAGGTTTVPQVVQPVQPVPQVQPVQPVGVPQQPVAQVQPVQPVQQVQPVAVPQQPVPQVQPVQPVAIPQQPVAQVQQQVPQNNNVQGQ